nr:hypothetical protein [Tanacetum cinerariifolium]
MHNNIMAAGSRDRPPMLATGRYPQWRSRFLRYIDTRPNGDALRKCILNGPYIPTTVVVQAVAATDDSPPVPEHTTEMWEAIERLQEGESLNIQDVKKNLFWEFALVATAQANQDPYYQTSKSQKSYTPSSKPSIPTRSYTTTRYKGKDIAKPITPPSESASEEDIDPEQAQKDKDMQKNLALIAKNQRTMNVARARENNDQNDVESDDERVALANLIANLKLDVDENKNIQKKLKKANTTLAQELKECKTILAETSKTLGESNSVRDSCLVALRISRLSLRMVKEKHDELVKQSLLTKSHYEGLVKQKTKMDNKKHIVNLESFREMLHICPRLPRQPFVEPPFEEEIIAFLHFLGYSGAIRKLTDVNINKLHQPWRSFAAIINK